MHDTELHYVWRYLGPHGTLRHAFYADSLARTSLCGIEADSALNWWGSGSQGEHEHCVALPLCPVCRARTRRT